MNGKTKITIAKPVKMNCVGRNMEYSRRFSIRTDFENGSETRKRRVLQITNSIYMIGYYFFYLLLEVALRNRDVKSLTPPLTPH